MLVSPNLNTSTPTCPDDVLVERAQARDATAFRELVRRQRHGMQRLASRFVGRPSDQEDVVQNALLVAWQHLPDFERRATFGSWMHRVTIRRADVSETPASSSRDVCRRPRGVDDVPGISTGQSGTWDCLAFGPAP